MPIDVMGFTPVGVCRAALEWAATAVARRLRASVSATP
jgi:hypothetical protein